MLATFKIRDYGLIKLQWETEEEFRNFTKVYFHENSRIAKVRSRISWKENLREKFRMELSTRQ